MLETTGAKIGFFIWVILEAAIYFGVLNFLNSFGKIASVISLVITGVLLYTQNWNIFFWYVLLGTVVAPFIPMSKMKFKKTISSYLVTVGITYLLCFGTYGILHLLNGVK